MHTFNPHVGGCCDGKDQEEEDEDKGLQVVCSHPLDSKEDGAKQLALEGQRVRGLSWRGGGGGVGMASSISEHQGQILPLLMRRACPRPTSESCGRDTGDHKSMWEAATQLRPIETSGQKLGVRERSGSDGELSFPEGGRAITSTRQLSQHFSEEFMGMTLYAIPLCVATARSLSVLPTRSSAEDSGPSLGLASAPWPQATTRRQSRPVAGMFWGP